MYLNWKFLQSGGMLTIGSCHRNCHLGPLFCNVRIWFLRLTCTSIWVHSGFQQLLMETIIYPSQPTNHNKPDQYLLYLAVEELK